MEQASFYDVLDVEQSATLDEIKLAFKKRALQVHPDKGGSKEAFHLVYQALETLADPVARKKYDQRLVMGQAVLRPSQSSQGSKKKKPSKTCNPAASKESQWKKAQNASRTSQADSADPEASPTPQATQSKQAKLLMKIRDLLKLLPREMRNRVITQQFSQKQRLILEKFMVDGPVPQQRKGGPLQVACSKAPAARKFQGAQVPSDDMFTPALALKLPGTSVPVPAPKTPRRKAKSKMSSCNKQARNSIGNIKKGYKAGYSARICFDALELGTKYTDLQTALEFLVILTSVKQRMHDVGSTRAPFEERLEDALAASASEQGRTLAELNVRFAVFQSAGFLIGKGFQLHSPVVHSVQELGRLRARLEPFRQYAKNVGSQSIYWWYSPTHLQAAWESFQRAVADVWEMAGVDSASYMQKIRGYHQATSSVRYRCLQLWERQHMAMQDKNKHRPNKLRERKPRDRLEVWERRGMGMHDKEQYRPKSVRKRFKRTLEKILTTKLLTLQKLLVRWERMLKREARLSDRKHSRAFRQKQVQLKKEREERRRLEVLNRKRVREEERMRRESFRKRMKSSSMDHLRWL